MFILYNNYITTLLFVIKSLVELNIRFIVSFFLPEHCWSPTQSEGLFLSRNPLQ